MTLTSLFPSRVRFNKSKGPFMEHSYSSLLTKIPADDPLGPLEGLSPRPFSGRIPSRVGQRLTNLVARNSERPRPSSQSRWPGTPTRLWSRRCSGDIILAISVWAKNQPVDDSNQLRYIEDLLESIKTGTPADELLKIVISMYREKIFIELRS
jgi:hypothetical protein